MNKREIQQRVRTALQESPYKGNVRRISLFGSQLHGDATKESDIDLLVEFTTPISMLKLVRLESELSEALGKSVDLSTPMSLSKYFRSDVLEEAEPIFEGKP